MHETSWPASSARLAIADPTRPQPTITMNMAWTVETFARSQASYCDDPWVGKLDEFVHSPRHGRFPALPSCWSARSLTWLAMPSRAPSRNPCDGSERRDPRTGAREGARAYVT